MPIDPVTGGFLAQMLPTVVEGVTRGGPRRQFKWNMRAAYKANEMNRHNQEWLLEQNRRLQAEQREYDSPSAQRARFKAAGINPNIAFGGSGGSAGSAFPIDAGSVPGVNVQPPNAAWPDLGGAWLRAGQVQAQTELTQQRTQESETNQALKEVMIDIAKTNPMLHPELAGWVATAMQETARLKTMEARSWLARPEDVQGENINVYRKVQSEVDAMVQRLGLNATDQLIKNKIFESKEFGNAILQIQKKWLEDGDMSPEHIRQGFMLILTKMLGK